MSLRLGPLQWGHGDREPVLRRLTVLAPLEAEIDELNDFLTDIARDAGQVMLAELSVETVP